ncbi:MAG TPA: nucleoside-diphosphate kinase [Dehalococcoidales bacterium]|nr:nucleoside-diphosphate kinase [Dehalococcoidales bacterium]
MERSLVLVKPDAMKRGYGGAIIGRLQERGLKLIAMKMIHIDKALAERHYAVHKGKPFFNDLIGYITSTPVIAAVFQGDDAIATARKTMGATDPAKADKGTIRADFGANIQENAVHGSDSVETAKKEISLYFSEKEIFSY